MIAPATLALLASVNVHVNATGHYRAERVEHWAPLSEQQWIGDCEDFALEKRKELIAAGLDPKRAKVWVVVIDKADEHAVLVVDGAYVLDLRSPIVEQRSALAAGGYKFVCAVDRWTVDGPSSCFGLEDALTVKPDALVLK